MSLTKKTITIPTNIGSNTLSETFGKISFTSEMKELLGALSAELSVRFVPGSEKPIIEILTRAGKNVCTLEEFKALSGYRRFVGGFLKESEKTANASERTKLISHFLARATAAKITIPSRMLEENMTKFNQLGTSIKLLTKHLEVIDETIDNEWRTYLVSHGATIMRVLLTSQMECMGSTVLSKTYVEDAIFEGRVPKWLYTKFLDKNFTNNLKRDSFTLLFPKSNFLKAIALTTKEIQDADFCKANGLVLQMSGGIIALAKIDFSQLFPSFSKEMTEPVKEFLTGYQWICTNPMSSMEILNLRETGKSVPVIRDVQPPKKTGKNQRPESELARIKRLISNLLNRIQGTWNCVMNYSIPVANPKTEFWNVLFVVTSWDITPTNSIYNCIRAEGGVEATLDGLRNKPNADVSKLIGLIACQGLSIPAGTTDAKIVVNAFKSLENAVTRSNVSVDISNKYTLGSISDYNPDMVEEEKISTAKDFLGIREKSSTRTKKSGAAAVRLSVDVLNELSPLKGVGIYNQVVVWLMTTFKTGQRALMQKIAAERILGEALKHQGEIFDDDFEEMDVLQDLEEFGDDDDY